MYQIYSHNVIASLLNKNPGPGKFISIRGENRKWLGCFENPFKIFMFHGESISRSMDSLVKHIA